MLYKSCVCVCISCTYLSVLLFLKLLISVFTYFNFTASEILPIIFSCNKTTHLSAGEETSYTYYYVVDNLKWAPSTNSTIPIAFLAWLLEANSTTPTPFDRPSVCIITSANVTGPTVYSRSYNRIVRLNFEVAVYRMCLQ